MKTNFVVQTPRSPVADTLGNLLAERLITSQYDEIHVSVAYMTVSGVRALLAAFSSQALRKSKWLIGLDDFVTQPGALDVVLKLPGSDVRIISYANIGRRFHPKVYIFGKQSSFKNGLTVIGSANLTAQGLAGNGEANAILDCETTADTKKVLRMWDELWRQGHKPKKNELVTYRTMYEKAQKARPRLPAASRTPAKGMVILASDDALLDPAVAQQCWIECGYVTAMGRELELKAEQGIFFGLSPSGEAAKEMTFLVSSGNSVKLRMKYQGNHMWRLQLTKMVPEVEAGLRPLNPDGSLARSPYVAVFDRTDEINIYKLRFIRLNSIEFKRIAARSKKTGTYGRTTARQYGWC